MSQFIFPDPNKTQEFTASNGITYIWDASNYKWAVKKTDADQVNTGSKPPANAANGSLWFDESGSDLLLYIYLESSNAWVPASPPVARDPLTTTIVSLDERVRDLQETLARTVSEISILDNFMTKLDERLSVLEPADSGSDDSDDEDDSDGSYDATYDGSYDGSYDASYDATYDATSEPTTPTENGPLAVNGYYPLYNIEANANAAGNGTSHFHTFSGVIYYMPNGVPFYHGNYSTGY